MNTVCLIWIWIFAQHFAGENFIHYEKGKCFFQQTIQSADHPEIHFTDRFLEDEDDDWDSELVNQSTALFSGAQNILHISDYQKFRKFSCSVHKPPRFLLYEISVLRL